MAPGTGAPSANAVYESLCSFSLVSDTLCTAGDAQLIRLRRGDPESRVHTGDFVELNLIQHMGLEKGGAGYVRSQSGAMVLYPALL